ncbi:HNH endonuclease [Natrarchaeobaculum sulfurireducens]|uniref:HNH endonuclease n=1 Tax=Natrarchaeobaculum sulfurireducens TaxID=2044521 RepID=UPI00105AB0E4
MSGDGTHKCPTCGDEFGNERGVKVHHTKVHDESIAGVEVECAQCGEVKTVTPSRVERYDDHYCNNECRAKHQRKRTSVECHFCGDEFEIAEWHLEQSERVFCPNKNCRGKWQSERIQGSDHPNWRADSHTKVNCSFCDAELTRRTDRVEGRSEHFFCGRICETEWKLENWATGEDNPLYDRVTLECGWCGSGVVRKRYYKDSVDHTFCRGTDCLQEWLAETSSGENNPNWLGGSLPYGPGWNESKKEAVRERDGCQCVSCGLPQAEHYGQYGQKLDVHHITPARQIDDPEERNAIGNLASLCIPCHRKWEKMAPLRPVTNPVDD